jgi:hypothetical protein
MAASASQAALAAKDPEVIWSRALDQADELVECLVDGVVHAVCSPPVSRATLTTIPPPQRPGPVRHPANGAFPHPTHQHLNDATICSSAAVNKVCALAKG